MSVGTYVTRNADVFAVARRFGRRMDTTIVTAALGIPTTRTLQDSGLASFVVIRTRILSSDV